MASAGERLLKMPLIQITDYQKHRAMLTVLNAVERKALSPKEAKEVLLSLGLV